MNAANRKKLAETLATLQNLAAVLETAKEEVRGLAEEEQEKFDNMPESLQNGEKGQAIQEAATSLEEIADYLDEAFSELENATGHDVP